MKGEMKTNEEPTLKLWLLRARNLQEPPFHFYNVAIEFIVAAVDAEQARRIAAESAEGHGSVWLDEAMTDCGELQPQAPGMVARTLSA